MESTSSQEVNKKILAARKKDFDMLMKSRYYYSIGNEIYGGFSGLYDWGPTGCAIRKNVQNLWRDHFILEEDMLEISTTSITPEQPFIASGHVKKFTDLVVRDVKTKQGFRADKLLEEFIEKKLTKEKGKLKQEQVQELEQISRSADVYSKEELWEQFKKLGIKSPETENDLSEPEPFNLMFQVQLGPSGNSVGYLRPETAQGMFVNFDKLKLQVGGKLPFAAAQIGLGFRNEIAPKGELLRVREFDMAEIEHFFDPQVQTHPKFNSVKSEKLPLWSAVDQENNIVEAKPTLLEEAVSKGIICNETMAYFLWRTYSFLGAIGINQNNIRFRQHRKNEMAHYACDCWDAEIETSHGWIECVGHANRSDYDLKQHSQASGKPLYGTRLLPEKKEIQIVEIVPNRAKIGQKYKQQAQSISKYLESLTEQEILEIKTYFETNETKEVIIENKPFALDKELIKEIKVFNKFIQEEKFTPWVIEPAFGLGRIIYATLEHNFRQREDKQRTYVKLPPKIAPIKVSLLPVMGSDETQIAFIKKIKQDLIRSGISNKVDETGVSIGKRYARTDELGIPFAITVDPDTQKDQSVTLREIETTKQIRVKLDEVVRLVWELSEGIVTWAQALQKYPLFELKSEDN